MSIAIEVEDLSKRYVLDHKHGNAPRTFRDAITAQARSAWGRVSGGTTDRNPTKEDFWAVRDLAFTIRAGDRVGIIGRNGAGKSTLLKLLSRITEPTTGKISINGRVASLLEVGTGFHPELSGRENIYLNGAILGMSRTEIRRKFDEIVSFAEVERFLDTPVKRYSSGMYVRLAFAVAAHLEPEILIVDEVLAVGDAEFQKKCLGRMEAVGNEGRTVLFVSHNMNAIESLCTSAIRLDAGRLAQHGTDVSEVIQGYLDHGSTEKEVVEWTPTDEKFDSEYFRPTRVALTDAAGNSLKSPLRSDAEAYVTIEGEIATLDPALQIGYGIFNEDQRLMYVTCHTDLPHEDWPKCALGRNVLRSQLPKRLLNQGSYRIDLYTALYYRGYLTQPGTDVPALRFTVQGGVSDSPYWMFTRPGDFAPVLAWEAA